MVLGHTRTTRRNAPGMRSSRTRDQSRRIEKCVARVAEAFGAEAAFPEALVAFAEAMYHLRRGPMFGRGFGHDDEKTTARLAFLGASHEVACRSLVPVVYAWNGEGSGTRSSSRISEKEEEALFATLPASTWRSHRVRRSSLTTARSALSAGSGATSGSRPGAGGDVAPTTTKKPVEAVTSLATRLARGSRSGSRSGSGSGPVPPVGTSQPTRTCSQRPVARRGRGLERVAARGVPPGARAGAAPHERDARFPPVGARRSRRGARSRRAPHGGADVLPVDARARRRRASHAVGAVAVAGGESTVVCF